MSDRRPPGSEDGFQRDVEELLVEQLTTRKLDAEALDRMRTHVAREWAEAVAQSRAAGALARRWRHIGIAAGIALATLVGAVVMSNPRGTPTVIGVVARASSGGVEVRSGPFGHRNLGTGGALRVGDRLSTEGPVLVTLSGGGTLRVAPGTVIAIIDVARLALGRGLLYVDIPPHSRDAAYHLKIDTSAGVVEHVGTEFEVQRAGNVVRIRVREGEIRFHGPTGTFAASAGVELLAASGRAVTELPIATFGREWMWVTALAPDYEVEGRTLLEFLEWVSREAGCPLAFVDAPARELAARTILHGSIHDLAPMDALASVLATTTLTYQLANGTIRVHSGS